MCSQTPLEGPKHPPKPSKMLKKTFRAAAKTFKRWSFELTKTSSERLREACIQTRTRCELAWTPQHNKPQLYEENDKRFYSTSTWIEPKRLWPNNRKNETLFWSFAKEKNRLSISRRFVSEALARYTASSYSDAY